MNHLEASADQRPVTPLLVLGGSIWSKGLFDLAQKTLTRAGIPVVYAMNDGRIPKRGGFIE